MLRIRIGSESVMVDTRKEAEGGIRIALLEEARLQDWMCREFLLTHGAHLGINRGIAMGEALP